jgi:hypothetical protein
MDCPHNAIQTIRKRTGILTIFSLSACLANGIFFESLSHAEATVRFAKIVFWIAGIWGLLIIIPLYFMFDLIGRQDPPPITHPGFFYGFVGVALAWQIAFILIATDPQRYRPLMIPSLFEKFSYAAAVIVLVAQQRMRSTDLVFAGTDFLLGALFVVSYLKTPSRGA